MKFYSGMDLHSTNTYTAIMDENRKRVSDRRLPNQPNLILSFLEPYRADLQGIVVESTYNWYWLVDLLQGNGYRVHLANPSAIRQYKGLKHVDDRHDAFWLVLPDGTLAKVKIDFETLRVLSDLARKEYGLAGCVQHGASTLPEEAFDMFPKVGAAEIHLATGFQNVIYDSPFLPEAFRKEVYEFIKKEFAGERKEGQTDEQFIYSTRKKTLGPMKRKFWDLPVEVRSQITKELEKRFGLLFSKLKVVGTRRLVQEKVKAFLIKHKVPSLLRMRRWDLRAMRKGQS